MKFDRFDSITDIRLRVFNRVVLMGNLLADLGKDATAAYISMFEDWERKQMYVMQAYIKQKGIEAVRQEVIRKVEIASDEA